MMCEYTGSFSLCAFLLVSWYQFKVCKYISKKYSNIIGVVAERTESEMFSV